MASPKGSGSTSLATILTAAAIACIATFIPRMSAATTIIFYDSFPTGVDSDDPPLDSQPPARQVEATSCFDFIDPKCLIFLGPPSVGAFVRESHLPTTVYIAAPDGVHLRGFFGWGQEPVPPGPPGIGMGFVTTESRFSNLPAFCIDVGGCQRVEDGTIQKLGTLSWSDGTVDTILFQANLVVPPAPSISLTFNGKTVDRIGQGEFARTPDGQLDGVFTVTLNTGSGNRFVTRVDVVRNNGDGIWNTNPGDGFWILGAATNETALLYNGATDSVNFLLMEGSTFKIFASDLQNRMFTPGSNFVVTVSFGDGTTAMSSVTLPVSTTPIALVYNGPLRDRVRQNNLSQGADGSLDPTFTVNFPSGANTRTVTSLRLDSSNGGIWDTNSTTGFWTLGAAPNVDAPLLNAGNDSVNFAVSPGGSFLIFASDWFSGAPFPNGLFQPGNQFTLTITFSDGSPATATTAIPANNDAISLQYNGPLQDRVADDNHAIGSDGFLDPTFTVTFPATGNPRTVTSLRMNSSDGGVWDTNAATGFWTLSAATNLDTPSYNAADDSVNFTVPVGGTFMIFASDWFRGAPFPNGLFQKGKAFTLAIGFNDGSTATATTVIP